MCFKASKGKDKEIDYSLHTLQYTVLIEKKYINPLMCEYQFVQIDQSKFVYKNISILLKIPKDLICVKIVKTSIDVLGLDNRQ